MTNKAALPDSDKLLDAMKTGASEVLDILLARPTEFWNLKKPPEGGVLASDIASDVNIRAVTFAYVVAAVACSRISTTYTTWPSFKSLTQNMELLTESLWWTRKGGRPSDLGAVDARHLQPSLPAMAAVGYMIAVIGALNIQAQHPYTTLLRYVEQDASASPADLEAKYTRAIQRLLRAFAV